MSSFSPSTVISADVGDRSGLDRLVAVAIRAVGHQPLLEDALDGLEVELGRQVHHRQVLVVEDAVLLGAVAVAADEVAELVDVGIDVAVDVHREEARELQEAGVDPAHEARGSARARGRRRCSRTSRAGAGGELVRLLRVAGGVHRRAHQHQRRRPLRVARPSPSGSRPPSPGCRAGRPPSPRCARRPARGARSSRSGSRCSRRGRSSPSADRHLAGVEPVGDVDVVVGQHVADGAAQQRGVVAGHRRDDQHLRVARAPRRPRSRGGSAGGCRRAPTRRPPRPPGSRRRRPACRGGRTPACRSAGWR